MAEEKGSHINRTTEGYLNLGIVYMGEFAFELMDTDSPVSYTHLTLPTIYSV